MMFVMVMEFYC